MKKILFILTATFVLIFAACGTPMVAARGGVVKLNQNEANAGNYLVIDGAGTEVDYAVNLWSKDF